MIVEAGHFSLILALACAVFAATFSWVPRARHCMAATAALQRRCATVVFGLTGFAFAVLLFSYARSDFSVLNVVENSHTDKPFLFKLAAAWGNHEGSMLLWVLILAACGFLIACTHRRTMPDSLMAATLSTLHAIFAGFATFVVTASNPFLRFFPVPQQGMGLNPILQDVALALHPPLLYVGYVGAAAVFALAVGALRCADGDLIFARYVRLWALGALAFLTVGIALGSLWAYYELGWGGYWFWDPVENASLLPWFALAALAHTAGSTAFRGRAVHATVLLAITAFSMAVLGTFLVRSGVITSVHAFAVDPLRGTFILTLLAIITGAAVVLYAVRAPRLAVSSTPPVWSRDGMILINAVLLAAALAIVLLGTVYPMIVDAMGAAPLSVGAPYYNTVMAPLALLIALGAGAAPFMTTHGAHGAWRAILRFGVVAVYACLGFFAWHAFAIDWRAALALVAGAWVVAGSAAYAVRTVRVSALGWRQGAGFYGMVLSHAGFGVLLCAIAASAMDRCEASNYLARGETMSACGRYEARLQSITPLTGANFTAAQASVTVKDTAANRVFTLKPERRQYAGSDMILSETAMRVGLFSAMYVVLGEAAPDDARLQGVRIYRHGGVVWVWGGCLMMAIGMIIALSRRTSLRGK